MKLRIEKRTTVQDGVISYKVSYRVFTDEAYLTGTENSWKNVLDTCNCELTSASCEQKFETREEAYQQIGRVKEYIAGLAEKLRQRRSEIEGKKKEYEGEEEIEYFPE